MYPTYDLARLNQHERELGIATDRLARQAACHRACCAPTRIDRLAARLGRARCQEGSRA